MVTIQFTKHEQYVVRFRGRVVMSSPNLVSALEYCEILTALEYIKGPSKSLETVQFADKMEDL